MVRYLKAAKTAKKEEEEESGFKPAPFFFVGVKWQIKKSE